MNKFYGHLICLHPWLVCTLQTQITFSKTRKLTISNCMRLLSAMNSPEEGMEQLMEEAQTLLAELNDDDSRYADYIHIYWYFPGSCHSTHTHLRKHMHTLANTLKPWHTHSYTHTHTHTHTHTYTLARALLQYTATTHCNIRPNYTTTHCNNTLQQHTATTHCNSTVQQDIATHYVTLQHYNTLQHRSLLEALGRSTSPLARVPLQHTTTTHCNKTLHQYTATTHCKTLRHTATQITLGSPRNVNVSTCPRAPAQH